MIGIDSDDMIYYEPDTDGILDLSGRTSIKNYEFRDKSFFLNVLVSHYLNNNDLPLPTVKDRNGDNIIINDTKVYKLSKERKLMKLIIGETVTSIGEFAFANCCQLKEVDFTGTKLTTIENDIFYGCMSLVKVNTGPCRKVSNDFAFCNSLEEINCEGLEEIHSSFKMCGQLKKIRKMTFSDKLCKISDDSFNDSHNDGENVTITCPEQFFAFFRKRFPKAVIEECSIGYVLK